MGLCSLTTRRLEVPGEDAWIEVRPLSARLLHTIDLEARRTATAAQKANEEDINAYEYALSALMLQHAIVAWSYPVEVTPENVDDLEVSTVTWLVEKINGGAEVPLPSSPSSTTSSAETVTIA